MNHVLIDCERTKYPNTGLYHFCLSLGQELIRQADPGTEDLSFYVPRRQAQLFGNSQRYVIQHPLHKFFKPDSSKLQVWHSTFQHSQYHPGHSSTRVVLTIHDLNFLIERNAQPAKIKKYLGQVQHNIDRADHIVCISNYTLQSVREHLQIHNKTTQVIYNGCIINEFPGFDEPFYRPSNAFIFSIGTVLPKKNFHVLPCLLKNNDDELLIAGIINKEYEARIYEQAKLHGVEQRVKLLGPVREEDKYWYYKNCTAFAFPSVAEGFGLPVVEAMYYGKPVFISRSTSLPEIGGDVAYYFDNFDPLHMQAVFEKGMQHYLSHNPGERIRQRALQFNWAHAAKDYLSIYRTLCNL